MARRHSKAPTLHDAIFCCLIERSLVRSLVGIDSSGGPIIRQAITRIQYQVQDATRKGALSVPYANCSPADADCNVVEWKVVKIRFYVDPATGLPHIYNHEVDEEEVEEVLREPGDDFPGRGDSRIALGQTEAGRYLQVIYAPDPDPNSVYVITAYDLKGKALAAYRRRRKRK